jgi:flagellin
MSLRINQNISAMTAHKNLEATDKSRSRALERLSSGLRINRAADDAAGLGISEKLRSQIKGLNQASRNAQDGISLIQTAEGALSETSSLLIRLRELAVQAASESITSVDRANINRETTQLKEEVSRIATTTEFNTRKLLDGSIKSSKVSIEASVEVKTGSTIVTDAAIATNASVIDITYQVKLVANGASIDAVISSSAGGSAVTVAGVSGLTAQATTISGVTMTFMASAQAADVGKVSYVKLFKAISADNSDSSLEYQIGANVGQTTKIGISGMTAADLGIDAISCDTMLSSQDSIAALDRAIGWVANERSSLGSVQNRLEHTITNLGVAQENLAASESLIRDVDMAAEMTVFVRDQIMMQAGISMLSQANSSPQMMLSLLQQ